MILCQKIIFFPIAEGGAKFFGVFRVKYHDFMPKNHIFSNFRGARAGCAPLDPPLIPYGELLIVKKYFHQTICEGVVALFYLNISL
jgi:hypothetical protein